MVVVGVDFEFGELFVIEMVFGEYVFDCEFDEMCWMVIV